MVDADGFIRGSSDPRLLGTKYRSPQAGSVVRSDHDVTITNTKLGDHHDGFRFVHPIVYAGRNFGLIEVSISKAELEAAASTSRILMYGLGAVVLIVVGLISFTAAKLVDRPIGRLRRALRDAAMGDLDFRISHRRKDEFGALFDSFNLFAGAMQDRLAAAERPSGGPRAIDATIVAPAKAPITNQRPASEATARASAADTPFDGAWTNQQTGS